VCDRGKAAMQQCSSCAATCIVPDKTYDVLLAWVAPDDDNSIMLTCRVGAAAQELQFVAEA
jgi:hypothetical protein